MRQDLDRILKAILDDVLSEIHNILKSEVGINLKVGKNTLAGSDLDNNVSGKITSEGLDVEFPHYIVYVEWDRPERYKNPPPYSVILNWIKRKNIQPTAGNIKTVEQLAWVFRYVIWRDGYTKRLIAGLNREYDYMKSPLDDYIDRMWEEKWSKMLFDTVVKELELYFKD